MVSDAADRGRFVSRSAARDGVVVVSLQRPDRRNAVGPALAAHLEAILGRLSEDRRVRAVVLMGSGPSFCAGADMKERLLGPEASASVFAAVRRASAAVHAVAVPVVAAVHGHAIGAGLELAAMCDYRVVEAGTVLGLPEVAQGIVSGGGLVALASLMGRGALAKLAFSAAALDAAAALRLGLADEVVPDGTARDAARAVAVQIAEHPREALVATKRALRMATEPLFAQQWASLGLLQETLEGGPAQHAALARRAGPATGPGARRGAS